MKDIYKEKIMECIDAICSERILRRIYIIVTTLNEDSVRRGGVA